VIYDLLTNQVYLITQKTYVQKKSRKRCVTFVVFIKRRKIAEEEETIFLQALSVEAMLVQ